MLGWHRRREMDGRRNVRSLIINGRWEVEIKLRQMKNLSDNRYSSGAGNIWCVKNLNFNYWRETENTCIPGLDESEAATISISEERSNDYSTESGGGYRFECGYGVWKRRFRVRDNDGEGERERTYSRDSNIWGSNKRTILRKKE